MTDNTQQTIGLPPPLKVGDVRKAWLGQGFTRRAKVLGVDQDGFAHVKYLDYPRLGTDYVRVEDLI